LNPILPLKAGKIILFKFNSNGTLTKTAANVAMNNGTVASIERGRSIETKELPDGNSQYPMTVRDLKVNDTLKVNMSSFQPALYAMLSGEEIAEETDVTMSLVEVEETIDETDFTVVLNPAYDGEGMLLVAGVDSTPFAKVTETPATGEFSVSADTLTFNSTDAGKGILIAYDYTAAEATSSALPETIKRPALHAIISSEVTDEPDEQNIYRSNTIIDRCKSVGELKPPDKKPDTDGWSYTLQVLKPRGGQAPVKTLIDKAIIA